MSQDPSRQPVSTERPTGFLTPASRAGQQALKAIQNSRFAAAKEYLSALSESEPLDRAWCFLLQARLCLAENATSDAIVHYLTATEILETAIHDASGPAGGHRLLATALIGLGTLNRRQDRPAEAYQIHKRAFDLFAQFGSPDEAWACAFELGLDADLQKHYDKAVSWFAQAVELASDETDETAKKQALAWNATARSFAAHGIHERSVEAARAARDLWRHHDQAAVTLAQADAALGEALVRLAEQYMEDDPPAAVDAVEEGIAILEAAANSLRAFGSPFHDAADICSEHLDFARRLRASMSG